MFGYIAVAEMKANVRGTLPCHTRRPLLLSQTRAVADTLVITFNMWNSFITRVPVILPHLAIIVVNDRLRYDRIRTVPSPPRPGAATPYALIELQYRRDPESPLWEV